MERELTPTERGYLGILNKGVVIRAEQSKRYGQKSKAWLSNGMSIKFDTAIGMHAKGLIAYVPDEDRPPYVAEYKISGLGKRLLEEEVLNDASA